MAPRGGGTVGCVVGEAVKPIRVTVFDVGETLVDETSAWSGQADAAGVTRLTLFAVLGAVIERGEHHRNVWRILGVDPPAERFGIRRVDLYPETIP